jgi:hypothetical protein
MTNRKILLRVVLVNVRDHDGIFAQFVELNHHQVEFDLNDRTKRTENPNDNWNFYSRK